MKRTEKRSLQRQTEKQWKNRKIVEANEAFIKVKSELTHLGWHYEEAFGNVVEHDEGIEITESPALKLHNEIFNITLIPHKDGIEISRLEVWPKYQEQGYGRRFLENILLYLNNHGVEDIYAIPLPAGINIPRGIARFNVKELQQFFQKRGFQKPIKGDYWKFDSVKFSNTISSKVIDYCLLTKKVVRTENSDIERNIELVFDFVNDNQKNFALRFNLNSYSHIKRMTKRFVEKELEVKTEYKAFKILIADALEVSNSSGISNDLMSSIQQHFIKMLLGAAKDADYSTRLANISGILIGLYHLTYSGFENDIVMYRFELDEENSSMSIEMAINNNKVNKDSIFLSSN